MLPGCQLKTLAAFFFTSAFSFVNFHLGLVRLIVSENKDNGKYERFGVLLAMGLSSVVIVAGSIPLMVDGFFFTWLKYVAPAFAVVTIGVDALLTAVFKKDPPPEWDYYYFSMLAIFLGGQGWSVWTLSQEHAYGYYLSLTVTLGGLAAQMLKSALRFAVVIDAPTKAKTAQDKRKKREQEKQAEAEAKRTKAEAKRTKAQPDAPPPAV